MNRRAFLTLALAACGKRDAPRTDGDATTNATTNANATTNTTATATATTTATATADAGPADPFATAAVISGKSIGHTSVVFKLTFEGALVAAYKPRTRRGPTRYRGEVAAYRLARAIGVTNVPRAIVREMPASALRAAVASSGASELFDREVIAQEDGVSGALIPWIDGLELVALEAEPWLSRWRGWLKKGGAIPDDQTKLAAEISSMVVFDYVTGNFDRWSGGNVGRAKATGQLLWIDNDGAFYPVPHPAPLARQLGILRGVDRFSKSFVESLAALGPDELRAAIGDEKPGTPLLSDDVLAGVDERRKRALDEIAKKATDLE